MDAKDDLILGVLGGTWVGPGSYPGIEAYVESIKRSGFSGRKIMLCWEIRPEVRDKLLQYGFELVEQPHPCDPFFHARMRVCDQYLENHYKEFRYIFWLDIKDLVLQSNPSVWIEQNIGEHSIVASTEPVPINTEETNWLWARSILGEHKASEIEDRLVINGGAIAGKAEEMAAFFHQTHLLCYPYGGPYPPCQISMNYVLYTMFNSGLYTPSWSEGFAACLHPCWSPWRTPCWPHMKDPHPVLELSTCTLHAGTVPNPSNKMIVFNPHWGTNRRIKIENATHPLEGLECVDNPTGKAFCIVHGYDRDWDVKSLFDFKYRYSGGFNLDLYKEWNSETSPLQTTVQRGLRSLRRERAISGSKLPHEGRVFKRH